MKRSSKRVTKIERGEQKKQILEYCQKGTGLYLFRNRNISASLELPKTSRDGKRWVEPNGTWEGDSYFLSMVPREAILVRAISEQGNKEEKVENKLILDQPDQVTTVGKVEHKVSEDLPLNEADPRDSEMKERLLTEDPMSGVTIIRD
jgi:hypothetical protein